MQQNRPAPKGIDYPAIMREVMLGGIRRVMAQTAAHGLPVGHHFVVTFATAHPGCSIPAWLKAGYPEAMTIILQHEFWGLTVDEAAFSVGLSFKGKPETLTVAFDSVLSFVDPDAKFGIQLMPSDQLKAPEQAAAEPAEAAEPAPEAPAAQAESAPELGENVVRLLPRR